MPNYWRDKYADDPAANEAHGTVRAFEQLPDSAGTITPDQMLARAQVFATLAVANQLSRVGVLLADVIDWQLAHPPAVQFAAIGGDPVVRDLRRGRHAAPGPFAVPVPLDQVVCDACGGDASQPSITCPAPCHPQPDTEIAELGPDARLVIDASCCIVLVTPERRITISDVTRWRDHLDTAYVQAAVLSDERTARSD